MAHRNNPGKAPLTKHDDMRRDDSAEARFLTTFCCSFKFLKEGVEADPASQGFYTDGTPGSNPQMMAPADAASNIRISSLPIMELCFDRRSTTLLWVPGIQKRSISFKRRSAVTGSEAKPLEQNGNESKAQEAVSKVEPSSAYF